MGEKSTQIKYKFRSIIPGNIWLTLKGYNCVRKYTDMALKSTYSEIEPFNKGHLKVSEVHQIYYEQCGKQDGKPIIYLHGGPGGGCEPSDRQFFDPSVYRIILFDQRGSGQSLPSSELRENTTWHLVEDIEKLREHLGVDKWVVFGGSWGSTLALVYAETYPDRVKALVLRGIFTLRRRELLWLYQDGASHIFPDAWDKFVAPIPEVERHDLISAYYRRLTGDSEEVRLKCAKEWSTWEMAIYKLLPDEESIQKADNDIWSLQFARIEGHYFVNGGFFRSDSQVLDDVDKIRHIPCTIVQGRYDIVCPAATAWELHKRFPEAEFYMIPDAGHSPQEPGVLSKLVEACDKYKTL